MLIDYFPSFDEASESFAKINTADTSNSVYKFARKLGLGFTGDLGTEKVMLAEEAKRIEEQNSLNDPSQTYHETARAPINGSPIILGGSLYCDIFYNAIVAEFSYRLHNLNKKKLLKQIPELT